MWEGLSKKRYKHIPVRFSPAIHGLRRFLDSPSHMVLPDNKQISFRDGLSNSTKMGNSHVSAAPNPQIAGRMHLNLASKRMCGRAFRKCAEPGMAEPKRHMDVPKERFSEGPPTHPRPQATRQAPNNKYPG
jgi:hypothetical protein